MKRHHQFFQRGIPSAFSDAIDRALELASALFHSLKEVGDSKAKIVVAVNGENSVIDIGNVLIDPSDQIAELSRCGVADGVGNVDRGCPCRNGGFDHLIEELRITAPGVFTGKLDILNQGAGVADHLGNDAQDIGSALAQFVLEMDVAGCDEGMDPAAGRRGHRISTGLDISFGGTGQTADDRALLPSDDLGDPLNGREVPWTGEGEARLDHIDTKPRQLLSNGQLLFQVEACAG